MNPITKNGSLICLYGINNIGKSTQAKMLVEYLRGQGRAAEYMKYPIYELEPSGPYINSILRGNKQQSISEEELQMWYTLNRFQHQPKLAQMLEAGTVVVAEDYIGTGLAWGSTKGAELDWLEAINEPLTHEDLAILLDGTRFDSGKETMHLHESDDALVERCRVIHRELAAQFGWESVNANQKPDSVFHDIRTIVERFLERGN